MSGTEIQGWFDYADLYDRMAAEVRDGGIIVELGVWKGRSLIYLARRIKALGKNVRVFGVDKWEHNEWDGYTRIMVVDAINGEKRSVEQQCIDNIAAAGVAEIVHLIKADAIEAASFFDDGTVDFVWFDDTHNAVHVKKEIAAWLSKARRPTWFGGHDFPGDIEAGVRHHFPDARQHNKSWVAKLL